MCVCVCVCVCAGVNPCRDLNFRCPPQDLSFPHPPFSQKTILKGRLTNQQKLRAHFGVGQKCYKRDGKSPTKQEAHFPSSPLLFFPFSLFPKPYPPFHFPLNPFKKGTQWALRRMKTHRHKGAAPMQKSSGSREESRRPSKRVSCPHGRNEPVEATAQALMVGEHKSA